MEKKKRQPVYSNPKKIDIPLCDRMVEINCSTAKQTSVAACQRLLNEGWASSFEIDTDDIQQRIPKNMVVESYHLEDRSSSYYDDECWHQGYIYLVIEGYVPMTEKQIAAKKKLAADRKAAREKMKEEERLKAIKDLEKAIKADPSLKDIVADIIK